MNIKFGVICSRLALSASLASFACTAAYAQEGAKSAAPQDGNASLMDIIVTANKRNERLQDVPIAISAVTSESLQAAGIRNTTEIAQVVPGLMIQTSQAGVQAHLRGVGTTALPAGTENSIATYIDGVYILSMSGALLQLSNIEQIEVLKGPQGTLFGRNATGGVISVRTRDPKQDFGGDFTVGYGNYDTFTAQAYMTGGLSDNLAIDIAGYVSRQGDGWGKNVATGQDVYRGNSYALRSKTLFTPTERDEIRLTADYSHYKGNMLESFRLVEGTTSQYGAGGTLAGSRPDLIPFLGPNLAPFAQVGNPYQFNGGLYDVDYEVQPAGKVKNWGVSGQWDHEFDSIRLQSITAYRKLISRELWSRGSAPGTAAFAKWLQKDDQFSQEFQLASLPSSNIQWVAGLYYLDGSSGYHPFVFGGTHLIPVRQVVINASTSVKSGAAFGQATIPLGEATNITLGGRYTIEKRSVVGAAAVQFIPDFPAPGVTLPDVPAFVTDASTTFKKFTWRVSFDHKFTPDLLGYASFNRGFKSGIYNVAPPDGPGAKPVAPEVLDAYEVGLKSDLFNRTVRLNAAAFFYNYDNLQVTVFSPTAARIENGAKAEIYGLDLDALIKPTPELTITGGLTWMHSEFKSYPNAPIFTPVPIAPDGLSGGGFSAVSGSAAGNDLPYAPNFTANVGANYEIPLSSGKLNLGANYSYNSGWYPGPGNGLRQPAFGLTNVQASWQIGDAGPTLGLWAKNIFKTRYYSYLSEVGNPGGFAQGIRGAPGTYGVTLGYKF